MALCLLFWGCRDEKPVIKGCRDQIFGSASDDGSENSRLFWVGSACRERVAAIRSIVGSDTLEKLFVLRDSAAFAVGKELPAELSSATVLRTPLKRVVPLSSAQIGYMLRLGLEDRIIAVGAGKYIADSSLYAKAAAGAIAEVSPDGMNVDYEKLIALKPDLVMTFAAGGSQDDYDRMEKLGIPVMLTSEWQENSLDAKADWLRLYGALFEKEVLSDSLLEEKVHQVSIRSKPLCFGRTRELREKAEAEWEEWEACKGRRVLAGMSYGGVWYAPGGRSYTADLIKNAGGCYLWASDTTRELKLTIEDVMVLADSADFWINPGMFGTPEEILAAEPRVAHIKAFKEKRVFQNDGRKGPGGGNDFFEGAVARPMDLVRNLSASFRKSLEERWGQIPVPQEIPLADKAYSEVYPPDTTKKRISEKPAFEWYHNIF